MTRPTTDFEQASERWQQATAARRELISKLEGAQMALACARTRPVTASGAVPSSRRRPSPISADAEPTPTGCGGDPRLQDRVIDAADQHQAEAETWRQALEAEQHRLAELCRPKHATAVRQIAKAVEMLSAAVQTEREFVPGSRMSARRMRCRMPGSSSEAWPIITALLSQWNRRMLQAGLL